MKEDIIEWMVPVVEESFSTIVLLEGMFLLFCVMLLVGFCVYHMVKGRDHD